jgi:hypothetical protein
MAGGGDGSSLAGGDEEGGPRICEKCSLAAFLDYGGDKLHF